MFTRNDKNYVLTKKGVVHKAGEQYMSYIEVGSPTVANGVASGFSTSNYLIFNGIGIVPANNLNSFEILFKVITPTTWTSNGRVMNPTNGADSTTAPYIEVNQLGAYLQWYNGSYSTYAALENLSSNTTYWFKWVYDGSTIKGYYSTNGSDYTLNSTITPPYKPYFNSTEMGIGCRVSDKATVCVWNGSVDLKETYIKVNDKYWWVNVYQEDVIGDKYYAIIRNGKYY